MIARLLTLFLMLLGVSRAWPAAAQVVEVPARLLAQPVAGAYLLAADVVAAGDGSLLVGWGEVGPKRAFTQRFAADLTPLADSLRVDLSGLPYRPALTADTHGSFAMLYGHSKVPFPVYLRLLDGEGMGIGEERLATCADEAVSSGFVNSIDALPNGFAVVYRSQAEPQGARLCMLDSAGFSFGPPFQLGPSGSGEESDVAARPGGGFVVVFSLNNGTSQARLFDATGTPASDEISILDGATVQRVAVNPQGGFAAVGVRDPGDGRQDVWMQRFADNGTPLTPASLVYGASAGASSNTDVAFDLAGDLYVVWAQSGGSSPAILVRGYDAAGVAFGPAIPVATPGHVSMVRTARLPDGRFVNVWPQTNTVQGNVVSLCSPGAAVCGDGVVAPQCEGCDDGAGNDDAAPDACRTDCRPARCGDDVVDGNETCDDGNTSSCDGCGATCQTELGLVCGDSVIATTCGETCDDGNLDAGDGCSGTCQLERIPGRGSPITDCFSEWSIVNPTNLPFLDKHGAINFAQACTDDDATCDFDGGTAGGCTFHVRVCGNNTELPRCVAPTRMRSWQLTAPSAAKAAGNPDLAAIRSAFGVVAGILVGPSTRNLCTEFLAIRVPLRVKGAGVGEGKIMVKASAANYDGQSDKDQLRLICRPH